MIIWLTSCYKQTKRSQKKDLLAVFLEAHGAFDNVNYDILLQKLSSIGFSETLVKYVELTWASLGNDYRYSFKGDPQGGILSPLLYIIYVKDIAIGTPKSVTVSQFADDICFYCKFSPFRICKNVTEEAAEILRKDLYYLRLEIAPDKTILIHFNNKNMPPGETHIKIGEHIIKFSATAKFLGITFDYKLSFMPQINTLILKCAKKMNIIKFLCGVKWGADPSTLLTLYKSYVCSLIDYGSFIFFPKSQQHIETLEKIQFANVRAVMGYRISTPTNLIIAESKIQSIRERTAALCKCY